MWQVSPEWSYERDPSRGGSEVEVTFTPEGPHVTRVDFVHRHLERLGPQAELMRRILDEKGGEPPQAFAQRLVLAGETRS
jgi:hypothetical protein